MKNLKIAIKAKIKLAELTYEDSHFIQTWQQKVQYRVIYFTVVDESYIPITNLQTSDFTFKFLNIQFNQIEVVQTAGFISASTPESSVRSSTSLPYPNPTVQFIYRYYRVYLQQILSVTENSGDGGGYLTAEYPATHVEFTINSVALDASGTGIFSL